MMYYWPAMQDIFGTLPPAEQAELIALAIGADIPAGEGDAAETGDTP